ncbi:MAG TPA: ATP-binding protein [Rhodothermales bacterium]|nr:ATP-binding protein [Rhodothermales bacterium]
MPPLSPALVRPSAGPPPRVGAALRLCAALLLAALGLAPAAHAQRRGGGEAARPVPIAEVLADADDDRVPDAVGDTVIVAGRALVSSGQLHDHWTEVYIQDGTGGLKLLASSSAPHIAAGDSLVVRGALAFENGMANIADPAFVVVPGPAREPQPRRIDLEAAPLENYEGQLVELRGTVADIIRERGFEALVLFVDRQLVQVFVYTDRPLPIAFDGIEVEDYVRVRGIAGQFDREAPYNGSYVIFPRTEEDIARAGLPPSFYRNLALAGLSLLALALAWAWALRRQVARRAAALRETEARYAHLIDAAADAMIVSEAEGDGHIVEVNRVGRQLLGFTTVEFMARDLASLTSPSSSEAAQRHLETARRGLEAFHTLTLKTRAGAEIPFEVRTRSVVVSGRPMLISLARDVTEREQHMRGLVQARDMAVQARGLAERARQAAEHAHGAAERARAEESAARAESERARAEEAEARERAEEMARLKSAFLANMSHEIRTPLTAIIGFAEVLREEVRGDHVELAETIAQGGQRLLATLNSVLDLARLDAGREVLVPQPLDLVIEAHRGLALLEPLANKKDLILSLHAPPESIPVAHDPSALDRVLVNLVGNAIKFTQKGGVRVVLRPGSDAVRIDVQDTGVGIDEAFLPKLFEEFHQESTGVARSHEGTGLGLAISKRLVELMGGTIRVASRKGVGTTFAITLPYHGPSAPEHEFAMPAPPRWTATPGDGVPHTPVPVHATPRVFTAEAAAVVRAAHTTDATWE